MGEARWIQSSEGGFGSCFLSPRTYQMFEGKLVELRPWFGRETVLYPPHDFLEIPVISYLLSGIESAFGYYQKSTRQTPREGASLQGKTIVAVVPETCGAGCGYLGTRGIEIQEIYFRLHVWPHALAHQLDQIFFTRWGGTFGFIEIFWK